MKIYKKYNKSSPVVVVWHSRLPLFLGFRGGLDPLIKARWCRNTTMRRSRDALALVTLALACLSAGVGATADGRKGVSVTLTAEWKVGLLRSRHPSFDGGVPPPDREVPRSRAFATRLPPFPARRRRERTPPRLTPSPPPPPRSPAGHLHRPGDRGVLRGRERRGVLDVRGIVGRRRGRRSRGARR